MLIFNIHFQHSLSIEPVQTRRARDRLQQSMATRTGGGQTEGVGANRAGAMTRMLGSSLHFYVFSYYRMCSLTIECVFCLTIECVLLLMNVRV